MTAAATIAHYGQSFPVLLKMSSPRDKVELLETVGKGNYGYVYKGKLLAENKIAAVKVVYLKEDELKETLLEMEMLQRCHHPNITSFLGSYLKGLDFWICMEYCGGGALDSIYRSLKSPLTEDEIACILYDTISALDYLHTEIAIIHRDLKAGNLLLTEDGCLKLADFGVSAQLSAPNSSAQTFIGTPYWMAPEVIMLDPDSNTDPNIAYTTKADIWSLGITGIEIAEKNPPLSDIHPMRALQLIPNSDLGFSKPKLWSKPLLDFIASCLIKNPQKRPSAASLSKSLFLEKAKDIDRNSVMRDLILRSRNIKERTNYRKDEDEDDKEDEEISDSNRLFSQGGSSVITDTLQHAKDVILNNPLALMRKASSSGESFSSFLNLDVPTLKNSYSADEILEVVEFGRMEVLTADILDSKYLLLGNSHGLFFVDLGKEGNLPVQIIRDLPFNQLAVLEDYSVLIAVSGRHSHIRQYRLSSIRKLIRYLSGTKADRLENIDLSYLTDDTEQTNSMDRQDSVDDFYLSMHNVEKHDEGDLVMQWRSDYVKVVGTRDTKSFVIQRTFSTIFLAALVKQDVILYQWASEPYSQFLKLKAFWLPERPKFLKLIHDGITVNQICIGYQNEANLVKIDDSTVQDIQTHHAFREKISVNWKSRWRDFSQIPFSKTKSEEVKTLALSQATVNRKLLAATTLKRPSHHSIEAFFLASFDRLTLVTDISVAPLIGKGVAGWKDGVSWEAPIRQLILRHGEYVVGVTNSCIQVNDWNSSDCNHKINFPADGKIHVLSDRPGGLIIKFEQKRKRPFIYWIKEKMPIKIFKKEDIIKPVKALSAFSNQPADLKISKELNNVDEKNTPPTYAAVAREGLPKHNITLNGVSESLLKPSETTNGSESNNWQTYAPPAVPKHPTIKSVSSLRRNVPSLSTDEYIRMRNQLATSPHHGQAILTRPIINAYNQPYSQHSYARPRPSVTYYGHRNISGYQPAIPRIEPDIYARRANPAAHHQMQPVLMGTPPLWVIHRPENPRPYPNDNINQHFAPLNGRPFHGPYMPITQALRPPLAPEEYGQIQNNNVMRSNSLARPSYAPMAQPVHAPMAQPVYAPIPPERQLYSTISNGTLTTAAPQLQQYTTSSNGGLTTPERRQSLSLSGSVEASFREMGVSLEASECDGDGPNSDK